MELVTPKLYTADEYLVLEEQSFERNEFVNGEIIPMQEKPQPQTKLLEISIYFSSYCFVK